MLWLRLIFNQFDGGAIVKNDASRGYRRCAVGEDLPPGRDFRIGSDVLFVIGVLRPAAQRPPSSGRMQPKNSSSDFKLIFDGVRLWS